MPADDSYASFGGPGGEGENKGYSQLRISNLRKFDKFLRKHRRMGTFTCSSRSCYSFNNDINEIEGEEDSEACEDDIASRLDIEEDHMGEIEELLIAGSSDSAAMKLRPTLSIHDEESQDYAQIIPNEATFFPQTEFNQEEDSVDEGTYLLN